MGGDDYYISKDQRCFRNGTEAAHFYEDRLIALERELRVQDAAILRGHEAAKVFFETKDGLLCPGIDVIAPRYEDLRLGTTLVRSVREDRTASFTTAPGEFCAVKTRTYVLDRFIGSGRNRVPVYREVE